MKNSVLKQNCSNSNSNNNSNFNSMGKTDFYTGAASSVFWKTKGLSTKHYGWLILLSSLFLFTNYDK
jgi:hypothetical protein